MYIINARIKIIIMNKTSLKLTSLLMICTLVTSQFPTCTDAAIIENKVIDSPVFHLSLPPALGTVQAIHSGGGPTIFHIQDAHGHYEAQKSIQAILEYLSKTYGIRLLLLEGSQSKLNPKSLVFFPKEKALNAEILDRLTHKAMVKAPELFLVDHKESMGYGIENFKTYLANGEAFKAVLKQQEKTRSFQSELDMTFERIASAYLSKKLRIFLKRLEKFQDDKTPLFDWLNELKDMARGHLEISLDHPATQVEWPMLFRVFMLKNLEGKLDLNHFPAEREEFLKQLQQVPAEIRDEVKRLLGEPLMHHELPDPETGILFEQMAAALPADFPYAHYSNVSRFIGHLVLQSEVKSDRLIPEINRLGDKIASRLSETTKEKKLLELLKDYRLLKKLLALELTPEEYETVLSRQDRLKPDLLIHEFLALNDGGQIKNITFKHGSDIMELYTQALNFYALAQQRNQEMLDRVMQRLRETGETKAMVITGGFHSNPFEEFFKTQGFNYALISPVITAIESRDAYIRSILQPHDRLLVKSTYGSQFLADPNRRKTDPIFEAAEVASAIVADMPIGRREGPNVVVRPSKQPGYANVTFEPGLNALFPNRLFHTWLPVHEVAGLWRPDPSRESIVRSELRSIEHLTEEILARNFFAAKEKIDPWLGSFRSVINRAERLQLLAKIEAIRKISDNREKAEKLRELTEELKKIELKFKERSGATSLLPLQTLQEAAGQLAHYFDALQIQVKPRHKTLAMPTQKALTTIPGETPPAPEEKAPPISNPISGHLDTPDELNALAPGEEGLLDLSLELDLDGDDNVPAPELTEESRHPQDEPPPLAMILEEPSVDNHPVDFDFEKGGEYAVARNKVISNPSAQRNKKIIYIAGIFSLSLAAFLITYFLYASISSPPPPAGKEKIAVKVPSVPKAVREKDDDEIEDGERPEKIPTKLDAEAFRQKMVVEHTENLRQELKEKRAEMKILRGKEEALRDELSKVAAVLDALKERKKSVEGEVTTAERDNPTNTILDFEATNAQIRNGKKKLLEIDREIISAKTQLDGWGTFQGKVTILDQEIKHLERRLDTTVTGRPDVRIEQKQGPPQKAKNPEPRSEARSAIIRWGVIPGLSISAGIILAVLAANLGKPLPKKPVPVAVPTVVKKETEKELKKEIPLPPKEKAPDLAHLKIFNELAEKRKKLEEFQAQKKSVENRIEQEKANLARISKEIEELERKAAEVPILRKKDSEWTEQETKTYQELLKAQEQAPKNSQVMKTIKIPAGANGKLQLFDQIPESHVADFAARLFDRNVLDRLDRWEDPSYPPLKLLNPPGMKARRNEGASVKGKLEAFQRQLDRVNEDIRATEFDLQLLEKLKPGPKQSAAAVKRKPPIAKNVNPGRATGKDPAAIANILLTREFRTIARLSQDALRERIRGTYGPVVFNAMVREFLGPEAMAAGTGSVRTGLPARAVSEKASFGALYPFFSQGTDARPLTLFLRRTDIPAKPEVLDELLLLALSNPKLTITVWPNGTPQQINAFRSELRQYSVRRYQSFPEKRLIIEATPPNYAKEVQVRMSASHGPAGFVGETEELVAELGMRKGLVRVVSPGAFQGLTALLLNQYLLRKLPFDIFTRILTGQDLDPDQWNRLTAALKIRQAFLTAA